MANVLSKRTDLRYLSDQDKSDLQRGGGRSQQEQAYRRARAYKGNMAQNAKRQERTTERTPGTGGFAPDANTLQSARNREIGQENERAESLMPDKDSSIYDDIYKDQP